MSVAIADSTLGAEQANAINDAARLGLEAARANASRTVAAHVKGSTPLAAQQRQSGNAANVDTQPSGAGVGDPTAPLSAAVASPASAAAGNTKEAAVDYNANCSNKIKIDNPNLEKLQKHVQAYIDDIFKDKENFKVTEDQLSDIMNHIPENTKYIEIMNGERRTGGDESKTFDRFRPNCNGNYILSVIFTPKRTFKEMYISGGGTKNPYTIKFLIFVPGIESKKQVRPGTTRNVRGGKKNGTLKRNKGSSNHVSRLYTRTKRS